MNLQEFVGGTPATKPWLRIKAFSVETKTITAEVLTVDDIVVSDLSANLLTLNDQPAVPNPPIGSVSFFSTGTEFKATDPLGATVTFATVASLINYLLRDGSLAMTGNLDLGGFGIVTDVNGNVIFGNGASAGGPNSISIGTNASSSGGISIGFSAAAANGVGIGENTSCGGNSSTAVGHDAAAAGLGGTAIGRFASASANNCLAVGISAACQSVSGTAVGRSAQVGAAAQNGCAFGQSANASALAACALGPATVASAANAVAVGSGTVASAASALALGQGASASAASAVALGPSAVNSVANSIVLGAPAVVGVRPGADATCDLGTAAAEYKDLYLSGNVFGPFAVGSHYSTYSDTTCNNTAVETDISSAASFLGSLTLAAGQPLGMVFQLSTAFTVSSVLGDNLAIRFYANGGLLFTHNFVVPALSVDLPTVIDTKVTIRNAVIQVSSVANQNAAMDMLVSSSIVYDRTIAETWSVTAQWGAAASTLTMGQLLASSYFRGQA